MKQCLIIAIAVCLFASCAKKPAHISHEEIGRRTNAAGDVESAIGRLTDETAVIKAMVKLEISDGEETRRMDAALVVVRPDRIRIDAMDALADVWASAGSDGKNAWLYLPAKNRLYTGRGIRKNLNRLVNFDLEIPELISLITGVPPVGQRGQILQLGKRHGNHFAARGGEFHIWTDGRRDRRLKKCVQYGGGAYIDYIAAFDDFRPVGDVWFPHRIDLTIPRRNVKAIIEYRDVKFGGDIDPDVFLPVKSRHHQKLDVEDRP